MKSFYKLNNDKSVSECSFKEWSTQFKECLIKENGCETVGKDIINGKAISTVFLGLDHNLRGDQPHIFETMIFYPDDEDASFVWKRTSTWNEAEEAHSEAIHHVKTLK